MVLDIPTETEYYVSHLQFKKRQTLDPWLDLMNEFCYDD